MDSVRAFIAIELPAGVRTAVAKRQADLRHLLTRARLRWTPVEQMHLTLRFLGNVPAACLDPLADALRTACARTDPFSLRLGDWGAFPDKRRPRVLWIGLSEGVDAVCALQNDIEIATNAWGDKEERGFHPHITLARVQGIGRADVAQLDARNPPIQASAWRVDAVQLMRSELGPDGARHSLIARAPLR